MPTPCPPSRPTSAPACCRTRSGSRRPFGETAQREGSASAMEKTMIKIIALPYSAVGRDWQTRSRRWA